MPQMATMISPGRRTRAQPRPAAACCSISRARRRGPGKPYSSRTCELVLGSFRAAAATSRAARAAASSGVAGAAPAGGGAARARVRPSRRARGDGRLAHAAARALHAHVREPVPEIQLARRHVARRHEGVVHARLRVRLFGFRFRFRFRLFGGRVPAGRLLPSTFVPRRSRRSGDRRTRPRGRFQSRSRAGRRAAPRTRRAPAPSSGPPAERVLFSSRLDAFAFASFGAASTKRSPRSRSPSPREIALGTRDARRCTRRARARAPTAGGGRCGGARSAIATDLAIATGRFQRLNVHGSCRSGRHGRAPRRGLRASSHALPPDASP